MFSKYPMLAFVLLMLPLVVACGQLYNASEVTVTESSGDGFTIEVFDNSPTFSSAIAINARGQMIGVREVADEAGVVFSEEGFFIDGKRTAKVPLLEGFTNLELQALSDTGLVVGYASRPVGHPGGSLTAFVWDSSSGKMTKLDPLPGDSGSHAQDISADGTRISGYSSGSDPAHIGPCVWTANAATKVWEVKALSVLMPFNPFVMGGRVIISPDGQRVASCITVAELPNNQYDSSLFLWDWDGSQWQRKLISDDQMHLKDMNQKGEMAAAYTGLSGRFPVHIDVEGNITQIDLLKGDVTGEACGIDAAGTVVGFSDDPPGPEGGPQAFVWKDNKTSALQLPAGTQFSSALGINNTGQIVGLLDVEQPSAKKNDGEDGETIVKTLAFRWSPKNLK